MKKVKIYIYFKNRNILSRYFIVDIVRTLLIIARKYPKIVLEKEKYSDIVKYKVN